MRKTSLILLITILIFTFVLMYLPNPMLSQYLLSMN